MLDTYDPEIFGEEIATEEEIAETAQILRTEFNVEDDLDDEYEFENEIKYADWLALTVHRLNEMSLFRSDLAGYESLFFWDTDFALVFKYGFVEGIRRFISGGASIMGYGYDDVTDIFTDIGLKVPLMLTGTEAAFDAVGDVVQEKLKDFDFGIPDGIMDEDMPFR